MRRSEHDIFSWIKESCGKDSHEYFSSTKTDCVWYRLDLVTAGKTAHTRVSATFLRTTFFDGKYTLAILVWHPHHSRLLT